MEDKNSWRPTQPPNERRKGLDGLGELVTDRPVTVPAEQGSGPTETVETPFGGPVEAPENPPAPPSEDR